MKRDLSWIFNNCPSGADVTVSDLTSDFAVLGLSGRTAPGDGHRGGLDEWHRLFPSSGRPDGEVAVGRRACLMSASGLELTCATGDAGALFEALAGEGVVPVGAAQTAMRIEDLNLRP